MAKRMTITASEVREGDTLVEEWQREQRRLRVVHVGPVNGHEYPGGAVLLLMCPVEGGEVRESVAYRRSCYGGEELVVERAETAADMRRRLAAEMPGKWHAHPEYDALRRLERSEQLADVAAARAGS